MMSRVVLSLLALGTASAFQAPRALSTGLRAPTQLKSTTFLSEPTVLETLGAQNSKVRSPRV